MGKIGQFDTDTGALSARIAAHAAFGTNNLEEWVFSHLDLIPRHLVLELGCGTGKQTLELANVLTEGTVRAVDISTPSLALLQATADEKGFAGRVQLVNAGLDDVQKYIHSGDSFDSVVACYSIYYAEDPDRLFAMLRQALKPGGKLFFCGPSKANNAELKEFHNRLSGIDTAQGAVPFMEETGPALARKYFSTVQMSTFENPLAFNSADALHAYWRSYNLYDKKLDTAFKAAAAEYFCREKTFTTYKRVIGVLALV